MVKVIITDVRRDQLEEGLLKKAEENGKYITLYPISTRESVKRGGDNLPGTIILDNNVNEENGRNVNLHAVVTGDDIVNYSAARAAIAAVSEYAQSEGINVIIFSAAYLMSVGMEELQLAAILKEMLINTELNAIICVKMIDEDYDVFDEIRDDSRDGIINEISKKYGKKDKKKGKKNKKKHR